jgi:hypothetical protein
MTPREQLDFLVQRNVTRIDGWFSVNKTRWRKPTVAERYRLYALRVWELRYHLPLSEILTVLVTAWKNSALHKTKQWEKKMPFGVPVTVLTGKKSEVILLDHIRKTYPLNEHVSA